MSCPYSESETRDRATKRQTIEDPADMGINADAAFPGVDDGAPPGVPIVAVADVGEGPGAAAGVADSPQLAAEGVESLQAAGSVTALVTLMAKPN